MNTREVVQLSLYSNSTKGYVLNNALLSNHQYQINWDAVFNGLNKKYNKAFVRIHVSGVTDIPKTTVSAAVGYVSLVGLGSSYGYSQDIAGLVISDLLFSNSSQVAAAASGEVGYYIGADTRNMKVAPMCPTPQGVSTLNVQFVQENGDLMADVNLSGYLITIMFELFQPVE
jgi:hypothetical protein